MTDTGAGGIPAGDPTPIAHSKEQALPSEPSGYEKYRGIPAPNDVYSQAADENFPVASRLLPRAVRADLMALYGFARLTDDLGDEAVGDRLAQLDWLEAELERAAAAEATHPILQALSRTIRSRGLSLQPFRDLIEANRMDQVVTRYQTFDDLVGYCRLSANPVGRAVLEILGAATPERVSWSDDVCTGLQVVEHLQDVGEDRARDRVYLPLDDLGAEGVSVDDLLSAPASPGLRRVVALESARARHLLEAGGPLAASLPWRARVAVAAFAAGGMAALDAVERAGHDVLSHACRPHPARAALRLVGILVRGWSPRAATARHPVGSPHLGARP